MRTNVNSENPRHVFLSVGTWTFLACLLLLCVNGNWLLGNIYRDAPPLPHGDGPDYESLGYSLSVGRGFEFAWQDPQWQEPYREAELAEKYSQVERRDWPGPTTSRPPALPWLISQVYGWIPRGPKAFESVRWLSIGALSLAGTLAVWLAGRWTLDVIQTRTNPSKVFVDLPFIACVTALGLAMLDRTIKTYVLDFLTEPWALMGVTTLAWVLSRWIRDRDCLLWLCIAGGIFGAMLLFRSLFICWLPVLVLGIVWASKGQDAEPVRWWYGPFCFLIFVTLVAGPWWIRNCAISGRWMPMGSQGAASLRGGYSDESLADWGNWHADAEIAMQAQLDKMDGSENWTAVERELALADLATKQTWDWISRHRSELPKLAAMRLVSHWGPWRADHIVWKCLALLGWIWIWRANRSRGKILASIFLADALTTAFLYETGGRFLIPVHGLLYALAGVGLAGCLALALKNPVHPGNEQIGSPGS